MTLALLLDVFVPGDGTFFAASATGLAGRMSGHPRFAPTIAPMLAALPGDFTTRGADAQGQAVQRAEDQLPAAFTAFLTGVYSLYYTAPETAAVIAAETGQHAAPPQPGGHALPAFDPALVAIAAARPPDYRQTPKIPDV